MLLKPLLNQSILLGIPVKPPLKSYPTRNGVSEFRCSTKDRNFSFKLPFQLPKTNWKLNDFDPDVVKKGWNSLLSRTHDLVNEVTSPLAKTGKPDDDADVEHSDISDMLVGELTILSALPDENLSSAAVVSIEQFSRMNGLTGRKMHKIFAALMPKPANTEARNLVEYCCFRFLSRDSSDLHPCLEDLAFQRLIFIRPKTNSSRKLLEETSIDESRLRRCFYSYCTFYIWCC